MVKRDEIRDFAEKCDKLYVIEELDPFIEEHCKNIGVEVIGKEAFTLLGEYTPSMILKAVLGEVLRDLKKQGRCYVKHEVKQACFHITAR